MPLCTQAAGQLRFRSTPCAFCRVPAARPSGLTVDMSQRCTCGGSGMCRSREITRSPAGSVPWITPTTSVAGAEGSPRSYATIGRPRTEWPTTRDCCRSGAAAAVEARTRRARSSPRSTGLTLPAAPSGDPRVASELLRDPGDADDPARVQADEDPLVRGRPRDEQPAPVGRSDDLVEDAGAAEDDAPARDDLAL